MKKKLKNKGKKEKQIFLDYASATPLDPKVSKAIKKIESLFWQNPSSIHSGGVEASKILLSARKKVASVLFAHADEIVFTSGGTESNNLAIHGVCNEYLKTNKKSASILVSSIDHSSILEAAKCVSRQIKTEFIPVDSHGSLDLKFIKQKLVKSPILISFGYPNGEVGVVQDVKEIMKIVRRHRKITGSPFPYVHIDASQAVGILPIEVHTLGIDLMTIDAAKFYGPKGAGALFVRRGVNINPIIFGGGQEGGRRSGTENLPAIVGLAEALGLAKSDEKTIYKKTRTLQKKLFDLIIKKEKSAILNGPELGERRIVSNLNFCFKGIDSEQAVLVMDALGVKVTPSSSCQSLSERSNSYVVKSTSGDECSLSSIRFSLGRDTNLKDLKYVVDALQKAITSAKDKKISLK